MTITKAGAGKVKDGSGKQRFGIWIEDGAGMLHVLAYFRGSREFQCYSQCLAAGVFTAPPEARA